MKQSGSQCQSSRAPTPRSCSAAITAATALAAIVGCASAPDAGAAQVSAVQFQQQSYDHHFLTTSMTEIAALDGAAAAGWMRSDLEFKVDDTPGPGLVPVCRFYSAAFAPKSSHFFTAFPEECAAVKANPVWTYEGIAFYASLPDAAGNCEGGKMPVYRSYNGGTGGAPAHLYTPIIEDSCTHYGFQPTCVKEGVGPQGIAFCAPVFRTLAQERTQQMSGGTWDFTFEFDGVARTVSMAFGPAVPWYGTSSWPLSPVYLPEGIYSAQRLDAAGIASWDAVAGKMGVVFLGTALQFDFDGVVASNGCAYKLDDDLVFSGMRGPCHRLTATRR